MSLDLPADPAIEMHETRITHVWFEADGIARSRVKPRGHGTLEDAQQETKLYRRLNPGHRLFLLVDLTQAAGATHDFRAHMTGPEGKAIFKGVALLVNSPVSRTLANFFLSVNRPDFPVRSFTDENEALDWLKSV